MGFLPFCDDCGKRKENTMILDNIKNIQGYEGCGFDSRKVLDFVERAGKEKLPEGRYELDGDNLFAMIQVYETKEREECLYEAHRLYGDIQYMLEGSEMIYGACTDSLQVVEDRTPQADILFYDRAEEEAALTVKEGYFAIFMPQDGHMPCCTNGRKQMVKKIVFKFRVNNQ